MPTDKSPGPDGIPAQLYKEYWDDLKPIFKSVKFIWSNKKTRIKRATLMKPEAMGSLGLPNFQYYFWAAQL